jgi:hypothetical protein
VPSDPSPSPEVSEVLELVLDAALAHVVNLRARAEQDQSNRDDLLRRAAVVDHAVEVASKPAALRLHDPETLARAIFLNWFAGPSLDNVDPEAWDRSGNKEPWLKLARDVSKTFGPVPPPASDPETVERVARAMYEIQRGALGIPATFEQIGEGGREGWRKKAREALLNTTDDEEAQGGQ